MHYSHVALKIDWCPTYGGTTVYIAKDEDEEVSGCVVCENWINPCLLPAPFSYSITKLPDACVS